MKLSMNKGHYVVINVTANNEERSREFERFSGLQPKCCALYGC